MAVMGIGVYDSTEPATSQSNVYFYDKWRGMLRRCVSPKQESYESSAVCDEWLYFSNFKEWVLQQNYEGLHLDKDILFRGNKIYHPDKCVFVPQYVNNIFRRINRTNSVNPHGVFTDKTIKVNKYFTTKIYSDGSRRRPKPATNCIWECHRDWQEAKIETFSYFLEKYKKESFTDQRVIRSIEELLLKLQYQLDNKIETKEI